MSEQSETSVSDVPQMLSAFERWWSTKGEKWRAHEASRKRDYQQVFAAGYEARHEDDLVARGMTVVNRLIEQHMPAPRTACAENAHGDTHCWHWLEKPPSGIGSAAEASRFGYSAVMFGEIPVSPSKGAVHGPSVSGTQAVDVHEDSCGCPKCPGKDRAASDCPYVCAC